MQKDFDESIVEIFKNKDYVMIMRKAAKPFFKILGEEEIEACKRIAAWKALSRYDDSKGAKFMTYLYRGVFLECKMTAKKEMGARCKIFSNGKVVKIMNALSDTIEATAKSDCRFAMVDLIEEIKNLENGDILIDYYINNKSLEEIGESRKIGRNRIFYKKNKALKILRGRLKELGV
jgi:DNA-directed RNA polymerase specialized sigma subunit